MSAKTYTERPIFGGMTVKYNPEIEITPKTVWGTLMAIAVVIGFIWGLSAVYHGFIDKTDNRIASLEATREKREVQIKDLQNTTGQIKDKVIAIDSALPGLQTQLKTIQDQQNIMFAAIMARGGKPAAAPDVAGPAIYRHIQPSY